MSSAASLRTFEATDGHFSDLQSVHNLPDFTYFFSASGRLTVIGSDATGSGVLGLGKNVTHVPTPTEVPVPPLKSFACTDKFCIGLTRDDQLVYWGNFFGVGGHKPLVAEGRYFHPHLAVLETPANRVFVSNCSIYLVDGGNCIQVYGTALNSSHQQNFTHFYHDFGEILSVSTFGVVHIEKSDRDHPDLIFWDTNGESHCLARDCDRQNVFVCGKMIVFFDVRERQVLIWELFRFSGKKFRKTQIPFPMGVHLHGVVRGSVTCSEGFLAATLLGNFPKVGSEVNILGLPFGRVQFEGGDRSLSPSPERSTLLAGGNFQSRGRGGPKLDSGGRSVDSQPILKDLSRPEIFDVSRISVRQYEPFQQTPEPSRHFDLPIQTAEGPDGNGESFVRRIQALQDSLVVDRHRQENGERKIECLKDRLDKIKFAPQTSLKSTSLFAKNKQNFLGKKMEKLAEFLVDKIGRLMKRAAARTFFQVLRTTQAANRFQALAVKFAAYHKTATINALQRLKSSKKIVQKRFLRRLGRIFERIFLKQAFDAIEISTLETQFVVPSGSQPQQLAPRHFQIAHSARMLIPKSSSHLRVTPQLLKLEAQLVQAVQGKLRAGLKGLRRFNQTGQGAKKLNALFLAAAKRVFFEKLKARYILRNAFRGIKMSPIKKQESGGSIMPGSQEDRYSLAYQMKGETSKNNPLASQQSLSFEKGQFRSLTRLTLPTPQHQDPEAFSESPEKRVRDVHNAPLATQQTDFEILEPTFHKRVSPVQASRESPSPRSAAPKLSVRVDPSPIKGGQTEPPMRQSHGLDNLSISNVVSQSQTNQGWGLLDSTDIWKRSQLFEKSKDFIESNKHLFDFWRNESLNKLETGTPDLNARYSQAVLNFKKACGTPTGVSDGSQVAPVFQAQAQEAEAGSHTRTPVVDRQRTKSPSEKKEKLPASTGGSSIGKKSPSRDQQVPTAPLNSGHLLPHEKLTTNNYLYSPEEPPFSPQKVPNTPYYPEKPTSAYLLEMMNRGTFDFGSILPEIKEEVTVNELTQLSQSQSPSKGLPSVRPSQLEDLPEPLGASPTLPIKKFSIEAPKESVFARPSKRAWKAGDLAVSSAFTLISHDPKAHRHLRPIPVIREVTILPAGSLIPPATEPVKRPSNSPEPKTKVPRPFSAKNLFHFKKNEPLFPNRPSRVSADQRSYNSAKSLPKKQPTEKSAAAPVRKLFQALPLPQSMPLFDPKKPKMDIFWKPRNPLPSQFARLQTSDKPMPRVINFSSTAGLNAHIRLARDSRAASIKLPKDSSRSSSRAAENRPSVNTNPRFSVETTGRRKGEPGVTVPNFRTINFLSGQKRRASAFKV